MKKKILLATLALAATMSAKAQYVGELNEDAYFTLSYVNKEWVTEFEDGTQHENFWGEPDKRLHGFQLGAYYQPTMTLGPGLRVGLCYEMYTSMSDWVHDKGWDRYYEHSLYLPLHLLWDIRLGDEFSIMPYAGLGFNWAMYGSYEDDYSYRYSDYGPHEYEHYGHGNPRHWNNQFEYGAQVRFAGFMMGFTYSKGLTNHRLYDGYESYQNKIALTLSWRLD